MAPEHGENVTIVSCGNALGQVIPPMILYKGKRLNPEWECNLPTGTVVLMTEKGSMTTEVFKKWVLHFAKFKPQGKVLLIFDGASSHLDAGIVDIADQHDIILFCLPSNTTHELQPMDKSVFGPFEAYWDSELIRYWSNKSSNLRTITKRDFGVIFSKVWPRAATIANVSAGFRGTGIYPFNPDILPDTAFAPSTITSQEYVQDENCLDPDDPAPVMNIPEPETSDTAPDLVLICSGPRTPDVTDTVMICPEPKTPDATDLMIICPEPGTLNATDLVIIDQEPELPKAQSNASLNSNFEIAGQSSTNVVTPNPMPDPSNILSSSEKSFRDILETPRASKKVKKNRRKVINSAAVVVTKSLFIRDPLPQGKKRKKATGASLDKAKRDKQKRVIQPSSQDLEDAGPSNAEIGNPVSWYCHLCGEDREEDMRLCANCLKYVHEDCLGLTKNDKIPIFLFFFVQIVNYKQFYTYNFF